MAEVAKVIYYTDPGCPWSWAAEPALRRLQSEFADQVAITYVLGGMAQEITDPGHVLLEALDAAAVSGMPIDPRGWGGREGRAPRSTYPACLAVKAAAEQGLDAAYLRVLLEGFWLRRAPLDSPDALLDAARPVPGLDHARFAIDLRSSAIAEAFGADLERARAVPAEQIAPGAQPARVVLPAFAVGPAGVDGPARWVAGRVAPEALRDAVVAAGAEPRPLPSVQEAVRRFGTMATAEVVAATGLPWPRVVQQLWSLATDFRLRAERVPGGEIWHPA
ncbi:MAG TPA: DsbA family protein [Baekduia sp.]|uniref:DsbA family oxidoreductase n=1 Tax=Baekduia sp. TaxID=2600305 RepID=UPI002C3ABD69|nr:DsbA family protein [Baekduia sp.]HMJ37265.1 DsbA family protein [Baekduia sp.]